MYDIVENCLQDEQKYQEHMEILKKDKQLRMILSITFLLIFSKV